MLKLARLAVLLAVVGLGVAYWLTQPVVLTASVLKSRQADLSNGEVMFNVGGCASCHATPGQPDRLKLGGGRALATAFGTFLVPNISSDEKVGIGSWDELSFLNAMLRGVGRGGEHLYPAFPFTSYQRMPVDDVRDLFGFLRSVPPDSTPSRPHSLKFPFTIRRAIGFWKFLFLDGKSFEPNPSLSPELNRGAYLVEGPAHCAECHSPRNVLGAIESSRRFAGGISPTGEGFVPNISQHADGLAKWSQGDFGFFLKEGLTPDGQSVDEEMGSVIANTTRLSDADRTAMAAYLKSLPARPGRPPPKPAAK